MVAQIQAQIQCSESTSSKSCIICEQMEHVKGPILSMTQGSNRMTRWSPSENTVLMVSQRTEILGQTDGFRQRTYANEEMWAERLTVTCHSFHAEMFFFYAIFLLSFVYLYLFYFLGGGRWQGQRTDMSGLGDELEGGA